MAEKIKDHNNFFNSGKPSNFIVDLKKQLEEKEKAEALEKKKFKAEDFYDRYESFKLSDYKNKLVGKSKEKVGEKTTKIKNIASSLLKNSRPTVSGDKNNLALKLKKILSAPERLGGRVRENLNDIAAFTLVKFLLKLVYSLGGLFYDFCYRVGWVAVFFARLVYFMFLAVLKVLAKIYGFEKHETPVVKELIQASNGKKEKIKSVQKDRFVFFKKVLCRLESLGKKTRITLSKKIDFGIFPAKNKIAKPEKISEEKKFGRNFFSRFSVRRKKTEARTEKNKNIFELTSLPLPKTVLLRSVYVFAFILLLIILPLKGFIYYKTLKIGDLKGKILGASEEAVNNLLTAGQYAGEFNFQDAQNNFTQAAEKFLEAQNELNDISGLFFKIASFSTNEKIKLASHSKEILAAGKEASELGENLTIAANNLFSGHEQGKELKPILDDFILYGEKAIVNASNIENILNKIDSNDIPGEYQNQFLPAKEKVRFFKSSLSELVDLVRGMRLFLGMDSDKRYLFVFQNNTELRATGGFIGSFALVDFKDGKVKNLEVPAGGSYDTEAGLKDLIMSPEPLHLVNPQWHFWDANWWPDWPTSAKKLMWFYEKSAGPTVDGVISITPTVMERFLEAVGEIDMTKEYGVVINADNFLETTQFFSERKPQETLKPKKIIGDLMAKIIEEMPARLNRETLIKLTNMFERSLSEKHILFYFEDPLLEERAEKYGWDGKLKQTEWDYLSVINTNIAGGKSDKKIRETIKHAAEIQADGSIINTLIITREHTGQKFESFAGVRNVDWMRVYVPLGSSLIEARGFEKPNDIYFEKPSQYLEPDPYINETEGAARVHEESGTKIYEESGKTVFANWAMVDPGATLNIYIKYKLPFKLEEKEAYTFKDLLKKTLNPNQKQLHTYALLAQKQSGSDNSTIISTLKLPDNMKIMWGYPKEENITDKGWIINKQLDTDLYSAAIIE